MAVKGTTLIQLTSVASSPHAAEVALSSVIDNARGLVERLSGSVALIYSQPSTGTAIETGATLELVALLIALGSIILFGAGVLMIRNRKDNTHA